MLQSPFQPHAHGGTSFVSSPPDGIGRPLGRPGSPLRGSGHPRPPLIPLLPYTHSPRSSGASNTAGPHLDSASSYSMNSGVNGSFQPSPHPLHHTHTTGHNPFQFSPAPPHSAYPSHFGTFASRTDADQPHPPASAGPWQSSFEQHHGNGHPYTIHRPGAHHQPSQSHSGAYGFQHSGLGPSPFSSTMAPPSAISASSSGSFSGPGLTWTSRPMSSQSSDHPGANAQPPPGEASTPVSNHSGMSRRSSLGGMGGSGPTFVS